METVEVGALQLKSVDGRQRVQQEHPNSLVDTGQKLCGNSW